MTLVVDYTHVHRPTTGIERISLELFSAEALSGIKTCHISAKSSFGMVWAQWAKLPLLALFCRKKSFLCSGFPPSIPLTIFAGSRLISYIHDLFLIERPEDLNRTARFYMRPSFRFALKRCRHFLVNSEYTRDQLRKYVSANAEIHLMRPQVSDTFSLAEEPLPARSPKAPLRLIAIGTIEPRKNLRYAVALRTELARLMSHDVELHIVGRAGWGEDTKWLGAQEGVILHGYCPAERVRELVRNADVFVSTSKEEGLGLPLLEVQHGGLLVAASDIPVYREVLRESGCLLPLDDLAEGANRLAVILREALSSEEKERVSQRAKENVLRWNEAACDDQRRFQLSKQQRHPYLGPESGPPRQSLLCLLKLP